MILFYQVPTETSAGSGLYAVLDFLEMLCNRSENGRVLAQRDQTGLLKYLLLNPAEHFSEVVKQCRSVSICLASIPSTVPGSVPLFGNSKG